MMKHLDMGYYVHKESEILKKIVDEFDQHASILQKMTHTFDHIVIFATGSSANAAYAAKVLLSKLTNMNVEIKEPSMALHYDFYVNEKTLYFAISQGGHSTSTIEIVKAIQKQHIMVYVITSDIESPLAHLAKHLLLLDIQEDMPFVTAGESATIVYLWMIGLTLGRNMQIISDQDIQNYVTLFYELIAQLSTCIQVVDNWFTRNKEEVCKAKRFLCVSYGASYGSAREFETKFTETLRVPSAGFELEEFMHGPYIGIHPQDSIFLFDSAGKLSDRMQTLYSFLKRHVTHVYYFKQSTLVSEDHIHLPFEVHEDVSCLFFNIVVHLTSWYVSQIKQVDLTKSSYPDFDEMLKSKMV